MTLKPRFGLLFSSLTLLWGAVQAADTPPEAVPTPAEAAAAGQAPAAAASEPIPGAAPPADGSGAPASANPVDGPPTVIATRIEG